MFTSDMARAIDFHSKQDKETSYKTFRASLGGTADNLPYEFEGDKLFKGKKVVFRVVGWGGYQGQAGWYVFITYRATGVNHVKQHVWLWDEAEGKAINHHLNEFIA